MFEYLSLCGNNSSISKCAVLHIDRYAEWQKPQAPQDNASDSSDCNNPNRWKRAFRAPQGYEGFVSCRQTIKRVNIHTYIYTRRWPNARGMNVLSSMPVTTPKLDAGCQENNATTSATANICTSSIRTRTSECGSLNPYITPTTCCFERYITSIYSAGSARLCVYVVCEIFYIPDKYAGVCTYVVGGRSLSSSPSH